jgi:hypothetical protein
MLTTLKSRQNYTIASLNAQIERDRDEELNVLKFTFMATLHDRLCTMCLRRGREPNTLSSMIVGDAGQAGCP